MNINNKLNGKNVPMVSVIIPMYNAGHYIARCIESLLIQSYENVEILLVDDYSTDNTVDICKQFCDRANNIRLLELERNCGVSNARNYALQKANGEYLTFVDADDYVSDRYIDCLMSLSIQFPDRVAMCMKTSSEEGLFRNAESLDEMKDDFLGTKQYFVDPYIKHPWVWASIFKTSIIMENEIFFDVNSKFAEDSFFVMKYMSFVNGAVISNKKLYYYYINDSGGAINKKHSEINIKDVEHRATCFFAYQDCISYIKKNNPELEKYVTCGFCFLAANIKLMMERSGNENFTIKAEIEKVLTWKNCLMYAKRCYDFRHKLFVLGMKVSSRCTRYLLDRIL